MSRKLNCLQPLQKKYLGIFIDWQKRDYRPVVKSYYLSKHSTSLESCQRQNKIAFSLLLNSQYTSKAKNVWLASGLHYNSKFTSSKLECQSATTIGTRFVSWLLIHLLLMRITRLWNCLRAVSNFIQLKEWFVLPNVFFSQKKVLIIMFKHLHNCWIVALMSCMFHKSVVTSKSILR